MTCRHSAGPTLIAVPTQLFELVRYDFKGGLRARERTARLHLPTGAAQSPALTAELEVLEGLLKAAVVSSFESRATAYEDEVLLAASEGVEGVFQAACECSPASCGGR